MALLTVDELREHVETALPDDALTRILNAAQGDIDQYGGLLTATLDVPDELTEYFYSSARTSWLVTSSYIDSITSVTEDGELLDPADYEIRNGREIHQPGLYWGASVVVVYVPTTEELYRRKMLLVNLSKLYINADPGTSFQGAATWQTTVTDFEEQKQRLLWAWRRPPVLA